MSIQYSRTQLGRLTELEAGPKELSRVFEDREQRDQAFQKAAKNLVDIQKGRLRAYRDGVRRPGLVTIENLLAQALADEGFVQVTTPIIMSKSLLAKMGIDHSHPLSRQIYWLDRSKCLRPMLAPHLYYVVRDMLRLWGKPVGLFEVGPCFRKESQGSSHSSEFTMLNLAEFGTPMDQRHERLRYLAELVMNKAGIADYKIETESSEVYGDTIDIVAGPRELEVASCAMGPHELDGAWGVTDTWVGLGFGLERLVMAAGGHSSLSRVGRSLTYLNGIRLNL
jgi:pyrrolysyl-tRNA synthetase-like protein